MNKNLHQVNEFISRQKENLEIKNINMRNRVYLSGLWHFTPDNCDENWYKIKVPSFWNTPEQFDHGENWKEVHEAWYGYTFHIEDENIDDQEFFLCFEGVSLFCDVYLNGEFVGSHAGCFTPFEFNISKYLKVNEKNTVVLYVKDLSHAYSKKDEALYHQVGLMKIKGGIPDPFMPDHPTFGGIWQAVFIEKRHVNRISKVQVITSVRENLLSSKLMINCAGGHKALIKAFVSDGTKTVIELPVKEFDIEKPGTSRQVTLETKWHDPELWTYENPKLYFLNIHLYINGELTDSRIIRFGFREFWIDGRHFYLNGKKVRLYGESINKMELLFCSSYRKDYISLLYKTLKEKLNINCLRLHSMIAPKVMIDAADEVGMLIIDQSGVWSSAGPYYKKGGSRFLENTKKEFEEWVWRDINSPSVIVWDVENEMLRSNRINLWALELDAYVRNIDNTRPIAHSGSGTLMGRSEIYHFHNHEQYRELVENWLQNPKRPVVIGEWWIGGAAGTPRNTTGFDTRKYDEFEEIKARLYRERIIELRTLGVEGIMPYSFLNYVFRPLFDYRQRICLPDSGTMEPCPDFASPYGDVVGTGYELVNPGWDRSRPAYRLSYPLAQAFYNAFSPVAVFIKDRDQYTQCGQLGKKIVIINDTTRQKKLKVKWNLILPCNEMQTGEFECELGNCEAREETINMVIPDYPDDESAKLVVSVFEGDIEIHSDSLQIEIIAERRYEIAGLEISLYDKKGYTANLFRKLGIPFRMVTIDNLKKKEIHGRCLVIGAYSGGNELVKVKKELFEYANSGGRIWVMQQCEAAAWLPVNIGFTSCEIQLPLAFEGIVNTPTTRGVYYSHYVPVYMKQHPVFKEIPELITRWKDHDGRVVDDVYIKPLASGDEGFYNIRVLSGGTKQEHASALEIYTGEGCYLLTQYKLLENALTDPLCRRLFLNIFSYMVSGPVSFARLETAVLGDETRKAILSRYNVDLPLVSKDTLWKYKNIIIGSEQNWDESIEQWLKPWLYAGGTAVLLERKPGTLNILGNSFLIIPNSEFVNAVYVYPGAGLASGIHGTDTEVAKDSNPVKYSIIPDGRTVGAYTLSGSPFIPLVSLLLKNTKAWWYHAPIQNSGLGAVQINAGNGNVVVWQLDMFNEKALSAHFSRTLLTNLGVRKELGIDIAQDIRVLKAEEITIDGDIDEWLCDMEDPNVTRWKHAVPVVLSALSLQSGIVRDNLDASGVVYFMYDDKFLYVAAQVIDDCVSPATEREEGDGISFTIDDVSVRLEIKEDGSVRVSKSDGENGGILENIESRWKQIGANDFRKNRDAAFLFGGISNPYFRGYQLECAIPWEKIKAPGSNIGHMTATVSIIDIDRPHKQQARLMYPTGGELGARFVLDGLNE